MRIENKFIEFAWKMSGNEIFIIEAEIFENVCRIQDLFNALLPPGERIQVKSARVGFSRLKRNAFKAYRSRGESGDAG